MAFNKPIQWHLKKVSGRLCIELEAYLQQEGYLSDTVTARRRGKLIAEELNAGHCCISSVDGLSNLCQVDGQINVGETQLPRFPSNRPVKSTLTASKVW